MIISVSFLLLVSFIDLYQESFSQINGDLNDGNNTASSIANLSKSTTPNITNYSTYEDKDVGFQIKYPSHWELYTENSKYYTVASFKPIDVNIQVNVQIIPQDEYKSIKEY